MEWPKNSSGGGGSIIDFGIDNEFSQNTMWHNGNSAGFRAGLGAKIEYNHIVGQCAGKILNDGSGIQVSEKLVNNTRISHNWVHDSLPKHGIRFDTPEPSEGRLGYGGYMGYNVVWHVNGITVKGDSHYVEKNIAFDRADTGKCTLCVYYRVWHDPVIQNNNTIVLSNGATQADGGHSVDFDGNWPLAGEVVDNNYSGEDVKDYMVDAPNWDFRPVSGGAFDQEVNIGPYKPGFESEFYYIPGRKLYKTSTPIPLDGSTVSRDRDAVMFLAGDMAERHHFYLGKHEHALDVASPDDDEYQFTVLAEDGNILPLPELKGNTQYFWRVDVQIGGLIYKGDIWNFITGN